MHTCLNATGGAAERQVRHWPADARRVSKVRPAPSTTWSVAFKHVCMPTAATSSTSFDSIIHPMDQGKSTFNYMSIGWLFRKIFRKNRGLWRVRHPVESAPGDFFCFK